MPTQDEDSQQPMNVLVVAQYSDAAHVTGFAIKLISKVRHHLLVDGVHQPVFPSTQPHVASETSWRRSSTWFFVWQLAVGPKAAWIPSRDGSKRVAVGAKARAITTLGSKRVLSPIDRNRHMKNDMAAAGLKLQITD
jgi:hypothetical protein